MSKAELAGGDLPLLKSSFGEAGSSRSGRALNAFARGLALFFGGFGLLNVFGDIWHPGFDANLWWLDLRTLAPFASNAFVATASLGLLIFGVRPPGSRPGRWMVSVLAGLLAAAALANAVNFYLLLARGHIGSRLPIPLSLLIAGGLLLVALAAWRRSRDSVSTGLLPSAAICAACAVIFPLAQMFCFGKTDYRRPADVTVVLGARVYADGRPSDALADRVRTACKLYNDGLTHKLLFSGGPGDGTVHETESMKRMAMRLGVKPDDILIDKGGINTEATVRNTKAIFAKSHPSRILVVSHFYHLPRIKLAYQREGVEVYTVPAKESYVLRQMPFNMAREVAALWVYYLRPLQQV